jgi:HK97 family phage major capsid protein
MPTTRERLEAKVAEMKTFSDHVDAAGGNARPGDVATLNRMADEVRSLVQLVHGQKAVDDLAGRGDGLGLAAAQLGDLGGTGSKATGPSSLGAPALDFTHDDVKALHEAAVARTAASVSVKVASGDAPMSTIGDYKISPYPWLRDRTRILDLLPSQPTTAPSVWFHAATAGATAAAATAEGADKPESAPTWARIEAPVRKLAHFVKVTDEVVNDFPMFMDVIGAELIAGLIDAENAELLNGTGIAPHLLGLLATPGITTRAKGADTLLDALFKAGNDLRTGAAFCEPDVIVLHPTDWGAAATVKATDGSYLSGDPTAPGPATLWGTRVIITNRIAAGTGMVANLKEAAQVYVRERPRIDVAPFGGEAEFKANLILIRAEERLALACPRPKAIVKVTGL